MAHRNAEMSTTRAEGTYDQENDKLNFPWQRLKQLYEDGVALYGKVMKCKISVSTDIESI